MKARDFVSLIEEEHREWVDPSVDREVMGSADPHEIASLFGEASRLILNADIARGVFYSVSMGCVAGVELVDGRRVVIKANRAKQCITRAKACQALCRKFREAGFLPRIL
jgi:hypothetical protein